MDLYRLVELLERLREDRSAITIVDVITAKHLKKLFPDITSQIVIKKKRDAIICNFPPKIKSL